MATPIEQKRDEFRRYLEESGVVASLTKALIRLYEEEKKPPCAVSFVRQQMCETCPTQEEYDTLRFDYDESIEQNARLQQQLQHMRDNLKRTPSEVAICLETGRLELEQDEVCPSLLRKHLTRDIFAVLRALRTKTCNASLLDVIQAGLEHHEANIGIYAADAESYTVFADLFDPVVQDLHSGFDLSAAHPTPAPAWGDPEPLGDLDASGKYVKTMRLAAARNIDLLPFAPKMSEQQYRDVLEQLRTVLENFEGDMRGQLHELQFLDDEKRTQLRDAQQLFDTREDALLVAGKVARFWPQGRAVFVSDDKALLVWVNADDHMRMIAVQANGNLNEAYVRLMNAMIVMAENVPFALHPRFGFATLSPTDLGTTLRLSVVMRLPLLGAECERMRELAEKLNLAIRGGTALEQSKEPVCTMAATLEEGMYEVSNRKCLGITEIETMQLMQAAVKELIEVEQTLEKEAADGGAEGAGD